MTKTPKSALVILFAHLEGPIYLFTRGRPSPPALLSIQGNIHTDPYLPYLICCFHVFLGRPRRLTPGSVKFIPLRATLFSSRLCTCPDHRRRPLRIISLIGWRFSSRLVLHSICAPASIPQRSHGASSSLSLPNIHSYMLGRA